MSKKRKTRAQKIITQLRKELERQRKQQRSHQPQLVQKTQKKSAETKISYSFAAKNIAASKTKYSENKQTPSIPISFDPILIKHDLLKTFYLSIVFFGLIGFVYWYLGLGGEKVFISTILPVIREFFRL